MHIQHKDLTFNIQRKSDTELIINGKVVSIDGSNNSKITLNEVDYNVAIVEKDGANKKVYINNVLVDFVVKTDLEHKLDDMGIVAADNIKASEVVAPMPGKIIDILVNADQVVEKGAVILILEAMKMENGIKIEFDAEIKEVVVKKGDTVEKGEKLVLLK